MKKLISNKPIEKSIIPIIILSSFAIFWLWFYAVATDIKDWWIENILVIIFLVYMFFTRKKIQFTNTAFVFIFLFLLLHVYGAKMAYTKNEFGVFLQNKFHLWRNPYDRIVHFSFGFLLLYPFVEIVKKKFADKENFCFLLANMSILCLATIFELIEWGVSVFTDKITGETYVATQGDPWDAQKDIFLALVGSIIFTCFLKAKSLANKNSALKNKAIIFTTLLFFISTITFAQNNHFNLSINKTGICFGNSKNNNGIRLNGWDKKVNSINGINVSGNAVCKTLNGVSLGFIVAADTFSNGFKIGGLGTYSHTHNGSTIGGLFITGKKYNGIVLAGLSPYADTLNGLFVGMWGVVTWSRYDTIKKIAGLAIGGLINSSTKLDGIAVAFVTNSFEIQNGISIACINRASELHGFQFGFINYAGNNRKLFKWLPFFNVHLKKQRK